MLSRMRPRTSRVLIYDFDVHRGTCAEKCKEVFAKIYIGHLLLSRIAPRAQSIYDFDMCTDNSYGANAKIYIDHCRFFVALYKSILGNIAFF